MGDESAAQSALSYWEMPLQPIFRREFWKQFRIDVLRFGRDPRARKSLLLRMGAITNLLGFIGYECFLLHSLHDPASEIGLGAVLLLILVIVGGVRFSQWRESRRQLEADIASVSAQTTARVQHLAYGLSALIGRALGEDWLRFNPVPEGATVVSRSIQIESLREHGVWDDMPAPARLAMMEPDGSWTPARIGQVLSTGEKLNSLLWALALQPSLRPVEELLKKLSVKEFLKALERPAPGIRPTWDLRIERNVAYQYFLRCFAESVHRGELTVTDDTEAAAISTWMNEIAANPGSDYLSGASTIAELDLVSLRQAASRSAQRYIILDRIMDILDGEDIWGEITEIVYAPLLDRAQVQSQTPGDDLLEV